MWELLLYLLMISDIWLFFVLLMSLIIVMVIFFKVGE